MSEEITDLMPVAEILAAPFAEFVSYHTKQGDSYNFIIKFKPTTKPPGYLVVDRDI